MVAAVLVLSAVAIGVTELRIAGMIDDRVIVYAILVVNIGVAIAGLWTQYRYWWLAYAALSVGAFFLIGAVTPISGAWSLAKLI